MSKLVDQVVDYVKLQIESGVQAVQLFDSWVGCLSVEDFRAYVKPHLQRLIAAVRGPVPIMYFGTGNQHC